MERSSSETTKAAVMNIDTENAQENNSHVKQEGELSKVEKAGFREDGRKRPGETKGSDNDDDSSSGNSSDDGSHGDDASASLESKHSESENDGDDDATKGGDVEDEDDGLCEYERLRKQRIERNNARLAQLGLLHHGGGAMSSSTSYQTPVTKKRRRRKEIILVEKRSQPRRSAKTALTKEQLIGIDLRRIITQKALKKQNSGKKGRGRPRNEESDLCDRCGKRIVYAQQPNDGKEENEEGQEHDDEDGNQEQQSNEPQNDNVIENGNQEQSIIQKQQDDVEEINTKEQDNDERHQDNDTEDGNDEKKNDDDNEAVTALLEEICNCDKQTKRRRRKACGMCGPCSLEEDCGACVYCLDKPAFGGSYKLRRRCIMKQCIQLMKNPIVLPENAAEMHNTASAVATEIEGEDEHGEVCFVCKDGGVLICCDTCDLVYHSACHTPVIYNIHVSLQCQECKWKEKETLTKQKEEEKLARKMQRQLEKDAMRELHIKEKHAKRELRRKEKDSQLVAIVDEDRRLFVWVKGPAPYCHVCGIRSDIHKPLVKSGEPVLYAITEDENREIKCRVQWPRDMPEKDEDNTASSGPDGAKFPMGTRVSKLFEGDDTAYSGVVVNYRCDEYLQLYHIEYEDGDTEDMEEHEVAEHMIDDQKQVTETTDDANKKKESSLFQAPVLDALVDGREVKCDVVWPKDPFIFAEEGDQIVICKTCNDCYHLNCHSPVVLPREKAGPRGNWKCADCKKNLKELRRKPSYLLALVGNIEMKCTIIGARGTRTRNTKGGTRCGECDPCTRPDCGKCKNCLDKPKFGGQHKFKQSCILKRCESLAPLPTRGVWKKRCEQCAACARPDCGKCRNCLDKPKFGGSHKLRQSCTVRKCTNQIIVNPDIIPRSPTRNKREVKRSPPKKRDGSKEERSPKKRRVDSSSSNTKVVTKAERKDPITKKVEKIIQAALDEPDNSKTQDLACEALRKIANTPENAKKIIDLGAIPMILKAMKVHPDKTIVQAEACGTLGQLVWIDPDNGEKVASEGCIESIVDAMESYPTNKIVQQMGCGAFRAISYEIENASLVKEAGMSAVLSSLKRNPRKAEVMREGCGFLQNMIVASPADTVRAILKTKRGEHKEARIIPSLVESIKNNPGNVLLQESICGVLANVALDENGKFIIAEAGAIPAIIDIFKKSKEIELKQTSCSALRHLAMYDNVNRSSIVAADGIQAALSAMESFSDDCVIVTAICGLLKELALLNEETADTIAQGGVDMMISAMGDHSDFVQLQAAACSALRQFNFKNNKIAATAAKRVLKAMTDFPDVGYLQIEACHALYNLSAVSAVFPILKDRKARKLLTSVSDEYPEDLESVIDDIFDRINSRRC
eukprot:CAMPEP_0198286756 /NCGR_PEP_ID=MMETSP1449-20131203/5728_1 /TAXON_ID=420275 /ORGANISM="Attheya septentrionalis, Strain CCMP2084" /LENGTH=1361 /DNA_ID=CAMNT_0043984547 /DNA_START=117 /DNA_END=4202 /DNA_ORIENTATION=-